MLPLETVLPSQLQRLLEVSRMLSSTLDLPTLLRIIIDVATELTDTEVASILLLDPKSGELYFVAASEGSNPESVLVPLEGSIAGWIVRHNQPLILDDVQSDGRHYTGVDNTTQFTTRTMLGVPLVTKERVIGALEAINKRGNATYTEQDVALLQALASQAAVAIENVRLFQQSDLIAEIMHELKTPLMAMSTAVQLLDRPDLPEVKRGELLQMMGRETARLCQMTQDFLSLARLESGRWRMVREPCNLAEIIHDVVQMQVSAASARHITISTTGLEQCPPLVGDSASIKQVLLNLVSNAVKYNRDQGEVHIRVSQTRQDELQIAVQDTGRGIAPENLARLFERFYRVPDSEGFSEGAGLGLSIAKKMVEEHNGRIEVSSVVSQGTTFCCFFPL
jgi:signal transduction histidine kinase